MKYLDLTKLKSYEQCSIANLLTKFVADYCWTKKICSIKTLVLYKYDDQFYAQDKDCDDEFPEDNYLITEIAIIN